MGTTRKGRRWSSAWVAGTLSVMLAGLCGYAAVGGWRQTGILERVAADASRTDSYQQVAFLAGWETALLQSTLGEPDSPERKRLPAVETWMRSALDRMVDADEDHQYRAYWIAERRRGMQPAIDRYLAELDRGDTEAARITLKTWIEPEAALVMEDLRVEMNYHLAKHAVYQQAAERESRVLWWGGLASFAVGLLVLGLFLWSTRSHRRQVETMAATDALTGLPNRTAFSTRTQLALSGRNRDADLTTVLTVNLDGFRDVNEQLGHRMGDLLLIQAGQRLRASVRDEDVVARIGGDEFAVLLRDGDPGLGETLAARLIESFDQPFLIGDVTVDLEISIGAASAQTGECAATLLQHADMAMREAKAQRFGFHRFTGDHGQDSAARLTLLGDLRRALDNGAEITLHYQPKIAMDTGEVAGVEALARWNHPVKGPISPGEFIPVLETTSLIHRFTDRVLAMALNQAREWLDGGHRVPVAVNISTRSLLDVTFPDRVAELLLETGVPGDQLCIEVTEHSVMSDPATAIEVMRRIRALGVKTSIDDYGTGYSSMTYLKLLPLDELKVDRSFVQDMTNDRSDHALVESTVELGRNLGLTVVAEGVEDSATAEALRELGCDVAQGYLFAKPLPAAAVTERLNQRQAVTPA
ncbi:putative bifunctional diguanylate cyclase/phosphodiesterase [Actinoplanes sp. GCM10030250]|uniref:putative bifunctional diguanylate cyclase/phosphodiesterase n=1 Tax=Actinoplanes sp. GCM10030250 TaxID=3273376 RepID=UPI003623AA6F